MIVSQQRTSPPPPPRPHAPLTEEEIAERRKRDAANRALGAAYRQRLIDAKLLVPAKRVES